VSFTEVDIFYQKSFARGEPCIVVGAMVDKESQREVPFSEANDYANERGINYIEVSSKTGYNMHKLIEMMVAALPTK
jgi:hypothetical protein